MISDCRQRGHDVTERAGYVVCMELGCPDRPVKLPDAAPNDGDKRVLANRKKQVRRNARIEEWETFEPNFWLDHISHWMGNPYRRWWEHMIWSPVYVLCVIVFIISAIFILATTDWA